MRSWTLLTIGRLATYGCVVTIARSKPLGDAATSILAVLVDQRRHGYGIIAEVRELSDGRVRLGTGTLYGALARLQDSGLVVESGDEVVDGRTRRYYRLTEDGRAALTVELASRERLVRGARRRMAGAHE